MTVPTPLLEVRNLEVVYSDVILVLRGISLKVPAGAVVALLGANGAGKTTLLRAVSGLLDVHRGDITKGSVNFDGVEIHTRTAPDIVRRGLAQVMEGRRIFEELSVEDNLTAGAFTVGDIRIEGENGSFYFPIATSILVSVVLTIVVNVIFQLLKK